jgi:hypothetical protein
VKLIKHKLDIFGRRIITLLVNAARRCCCRGLRIASSSNGADEVYKVAAGSNGFWHFQPTAALLSQPALAAAGSAVAAAAAAAAAVTINQCQLTCGAPRQQQHLDNSHNPTVANSPSICCFQM